MGQRGTQAGREDGGLRGVRRSGGSAVLGGAVLAVLVVLVVMAALLVVSPASFVGLLPDRLTGGGSSGVAAWFVAGLSGAAAVALAVWRIGTEWFRGAVVTFLVLVAGGCAVYALKDGSAEEAPGTSCVAYSGGRQTCPGG